MDELKDQIQSAYLTTLLETGKPPVTPFAFCGELGITENDFFAHYRNFKSVEKDIWLAMLLNVQRALESDSEFPSYTAQEKILALFYTLEEVYKQNRSLLLFRFEELPRQNVKPWFLSTFRAEFMSMVSIILSEAKETQEVVARPILSDRYKEGIWVQFIYITRVWVKDESENYQLTDAAIEKSVNLAFELMKKGPVDLLIDFLKFAYQNKAW